MNLQEYISHLRSCIASNPPDLGDSDCETILGREFFIIVNSITDIVFGDVKLIVNQFP